MVALAPKCEQDCIFDQLIVEWFVRLISQLERYSFVDRTWNGTDKFCRMFLLTEAFLWISKRKKRKWKWGDQTKWLITLPSVINSFSSLESLIAVSWLAFLPDFSVIRNWMWSTTNSRSFFFGAEKRNYFILCPQSMASFTYSLEANQYSMEDCRRKDLRLALLCQIQIPNNGSCHQ